MKNLVLLGILCLGFLCHATDHSTTQKPAEECLEDALKSSGASYATLIVPRDHAPTDYLNSLFGVRSSFKEGRDKTTYTLIGPTEDLLKIALSLNQNKLERNGGSFKLNQFRESPRLNITPKRLVEIFQEKRQVRATIHVPGLQPIPALLTPDELLEQSTQGKIESIRLTK